MGGESGGSYGGSPVTLALSEKTEVEAALTTDHGPSVAVLIGQPYGVTVRMVMSVAVAERWLDALADCLPAWRAGGGAR